MSHGVLKQNHTEKKSCLTVLCLLSKAVKNKGTTYQNSWPPALDLYLKNSYLFNKADREPEKLILGI